MDAVFHALSDESRRTVLEVLRDHPATAGELADLLPIARPGVSRHLRVLREAGLVDVIQDAQRRIYRLRPESLAEADAWLGNYRNLWEQRLDALHTEIARGKRSRRKEDHREPSSSDQAPDKQSSSDKQNSQGKQSTRDRQSTRDEQSRRSA